MLPAEGSIVAFLNRVGRVGGAGWAGTISRRRRW